MALGFTPSARGLGRPAFARLAAASLLAFALSGCWAWWPQPSLEEAATSALAAYPGSATVQAWAAEAKAQGPLTDPLVTAEVGLGNLRLGTPATELQRHLGSPSLGGSARPGARWQWSHPGAGSVVAELAGSPVAVARLEAWAPSEASTRAQIRPGDDAARILRKYGAKPFAKAWGLRGCELWVVPKANAAFVVGPVHWEKGEALPRRVLGVLVGGFGG